MIGYFMWRGKLWGKWSNLFLSFSKDHSWFWFQVEALFPFYLEEFVVNIVTPILLPFFMEDKSDFGHQVCIRILNLSVAIFSFDLTAESVLSFPLISMFIGVVGTLPILL